MKQLFSCVLFQLILSMHAHAQTQPARHINLRIRSNDSVVASLNNDYCLIEDSCAQILRYSRFDFQRRKFIGKFKDVNKNDTTQILSEGNYSQDGLKDGDFIVYYLNGKIHAKGSFKNNEYAGNWEFYNEDGSPQLTFNVIDGNIHIIDAWNENNKKTVTNGSGKYEVNSFLVFYYWTGHLVNGTPDGTWKLVNKNNPDNGQLLTEYFENGHFLKGENAVKEYADSSHIVLVSPNALTLVNADKLRLSLVSCDLTNMRSDFVNAKYAYGDKALLNLLGTIVSNYFNVNFKDNMHLSSYTRFVSIHGEIDEKGDLVNLALDQKSFIEQGLVEGLAGNFIRSEPAKVHGKPVKQRIVFTFNFANGACNYGYQLLPVNLKQ